MFDYEEANFCVSFEKMEKQLNILEINCSVRVANSVSRELANEFIAAVQKSNPNAVHTKRDVGLNPPAHPSESFTVANYTSPEARTEEMKAVLADSDRLIDELAAANLVVLGCPMYNFSVPSNFKAYVDNIVRVGRTFAFDRETFAFTPLLSEQKAVVISPSAGDYAAKTPAAEWDFCTPYLRSILAFIGIADVEIIPVPNQFMPEDVRQASIETVREKLLELAAKI